MSEIHIVHAPAGVIIVVTVRAFLCVCFLCVFTCVCSVYVRMRVVCAHACVLTSVCVCVCVCLLCMCAGVCSVCLCVLCLCAGVPCKLGNVDPVSISYPVRMVGMGQVGLDVGWEQVVTGARAGVGELFLRELQSENM